MLGVSRFTISRLIHAGQRAPQKQVDAAT
jgi:hypothetical protein